jgi:arylsulfatase A-like enzyme
MDVAPTLLQLSGLDPSLLLKPNGLDSKQAWAPQLLPLRPTQADREASPTRVALGDLHGRLASIRTPAFKLIVELASSRAEFYDLSQDPAESRNLSSDSHSEQRSFLTQTLQSSRAALSGDSHAERVVLDEEQLELLRSLGYVK